MHDTTELRARLRAQISLKTLVEETTRLWPDRSDVRGACPLHPDSSSSLYVAWDRHFHCFACGAGGDVVDWTRRVHRLNEAEAIGLLLQYVQSRAPETEG